MTPQAKSIEAAMPTAEEVFDKPWETPTVQCPLAWQGDSIAVELADRECARLLAFAMRNPLATKEETRRREHGDNRR